MTDPVIDPHGATAPANHSASHLFALAACLLRAPPSQDALDHVADAAFTSGEPALDQGLLWLQQAAEQTDAAAQARAYQDLFIGLGHGELRPFASFYLTGSLFTLPLVALRRDLNRLGFCRQAEVTEPEDHAAALCEVMVQLLSEDIARAETFYCAHLAPWLGRFADDLATQGHSALYQALGDVLRALVAKLTPPETL
ncbi:MAG: TorD/DmsD family molecular chaperone [Aeromonas sp.]